MPRPTRTRSVAERSPTMPPDPMVHVIDDDDAVRESLEFLLRTAQIPVRTYDSATAFPQRRYVELRKYGATANLFTFKSVFEDVGPFDEGLRSGGDYEWGRRVHSSGYGQVYADDVRVWHPARRSFGQLRGKIVRVAGGHRSSPEPADSSRFKLELLVRLLPPVRGALRVLSNKRLGGIGDRLKVVLVMCLVRYLQVWERLRVRLGGKPEG